MEPRIIQLMARKLSGEATAADLDELNELLTRHPEAIYYAELITQLWDEEKMPGVNKTITDTDISYLRHLARHRPEFRETSSVIRETPFINDPDPFLQSSSIRWRTRRLSWAFFITVVLAGGGYIVSRLLAPQPAATRVNTELFAGLGSRRSLFLPDGTRVWLNAGSRIQYDSDMLHKNTRDLSLSGEAFFDVVKDKDRPFIIHTDKIAIKVLGTAFNVKAYPHDRITETTLMRGSIELTVNNKPYQKIILKPREKFDLIDGGHDEPRDSAGIRTGPAKPSRNENPEKLVVQDVVPVQVEDKEYVKEVSWVDDEFVFQNETLEELAPKMERWFNVRIRIDNPQVRNYHYTGIFHKETIDQALTAMRLIRPFNFKITDSHVFIH